MRTGEKKVQNPHKDGDFCSFATLFSYVLEKFGDSPCSSLMDLCTRGVHTGGDETLMPPLGSVESSEEVLTKIWTVSMGGIIPRLTTNTILSKSSSITMCPVRMGSSNVLINNHGDYDPACVILHNRFPS